MILCGGSGTRLWSLSRPERPRPFLNLLGDRTLFQQTLDRVADCSRFAEPIVVAGEAHASLVTDEAGSHSLIVEPAARNTAPAIALAAARLPPERIMLVCPSDHHVADEASLVRTVDQAAALVQEGWLVCLGVLPDRPETGYGYIEPGEILQSGSRVARLIEKPDADAGRDYLSRGGFVWNAGIFVMQAGDYLTQLERHRPEMVRQVRSSTENRTDTGSIFHPAAAKFLSIEAESVDYALMEHNDRAVVIAADMGWSDIGNWDALAAIRRADEAGDIVSAKEAELIDCHRVMIQSDGPRVSAVGLRDVTIAVDGDEILVIACGSAADVAKLGGANGK